MRKVSIIIPIIHEERVADCLAAIRANAGIPEHRYEIVTDIDYDRIGCPKMVKRLTNLSQYDLVMFLGDDTIPQDGFLKTAVDYMDSLPQGWGLVGLNDGMQNGELLATHWLAHKNLLDYCENREFFYTGYIHQYCDNELTEIAKGLGRYVWAKEARITHNHPFKDEKFRDDDYERVYSDEASRHDAKLFLKRKKAKGYFKLGIGFPLTDKKIDTPFFVSWTTMERPDFTLLMPNAPGPIDTIRNNLVVQALREQCSHLLMMDTDQVYPADTIPKLLSHERDVVAVNVHRRYPPFDPIMYHGELGNYHHVPDEDCFSGKLIEVDATGCGCILFNTEVFLDVPYPWFNIYRMRDGRLVGEDVSFCSKLKDARYSIFVDTSIEVGHLSTLEITKEFYLLFKKIKGFKWGPPPPELEAEEFSDLEVKDGR